MIILTKKKLLTSSILTVYLLLCPLENRAQYVKDNLTSNQKLEQSKSNEGLTKQTRARTRNISSHENFLKNRGYINLKGPKITLKLKDANSKDILKEISKLGGYGFVFVEDEVAKGSKSKNSNERKVTLSLDNEDYSVSINSILLSAGLQAKRQNNLLLIGPNVLGLSFDSKLSKVYRLNQATADSAADYLASLGASISKVKIITTNTSSGGGTSTSSPKTSISQSLSNVETYSASTGPLKGLTGTTDSRLNQITLIGEPSLIEVAEKYLKQLDVRQRQVALSVKIIDVKLSEEEGLDNSFSLRTGNTFIINNNGSLAAVFGSLLPAANISSAKPENNPGRGYPDGGFYDSLISNIRSRSSNTLASPTLILNESSEPLQGVGRSAANESFISVGSNIITNFTYSKGEEGESDKCVAGFETAGLELAAKVHKIDDNGYVTFSLSPSLTAISDVYNNPMCGNYYTLNARKLDTGTVRVKDGQTLILTGVLQSLESETTSKLPILGDLPILGNVFKSQGKTNENRELIIMVTPKIINDSIDTTAQVYKPSPTITRELEEE